MSRNLPRLNKPSKSSSKTPRVPTTADAQDRRLSGLTAEERRQAQLNPGLKPENQIKAYNDEIKKVEARIKRLEPAFKGVQDSLTKAFGFLFEGTILTYPDAKAKLDTLRRQKSTLENLLRNFRSSTNPSKESQKPQEDKKEGAAPPATAEEPGTPAAPLAVIYNAGAVNDAYFKIDQSFFKKQSDSKGYARGATEIDSYIYSGNTPKTTVLDAVELWKNSSSGKGMIQTWKPPGTTPQAAMDGSWTGLSTSKTFQRYGFQFLYNPGNISMSYGGVPDIDPSMMSSGTEEYLLQNPSVFKSAINFDVLINRMFDMQYLGPGGKLKGDTDVNKIYSGKIPTDRDLKKIYNRGTMYDVEFLLQTMFSYAPLATQLRNKTSDVGYLGAFPVEMHLGNKLRYVVLIDSINVNHVIFDHRMVPLFTNVSISARRIPDFKAGVISDASQSSTIVPGSSLNPNAPGAGALLRGVSIR
jgi:hypothetical protein